MSQQKDLGLGQLITTTQFRDAIHVAVAPVIANEYLKPGQHVGIIKVDNDEYFVGTSNTEVGIVDPFLKKAVAKGQRFWLFLYPNTVTSLRHEWTHPSFKPSINDDEVVDSINWLTNFAAECELSYNDLIRGLDNYVKTGREICLGTNTPDICYSNRSQMWKHYQIVTGKTVDDEELREGYVFRCAC